MRKTLFLILSFIVISTVAWTQQLTIEGTVTENSTGENLPGVNVVNLTTQSGAITDLEGHYEIKASPGDILSFSYIGYYSQEVSIGNITMVDISLEEDVQSLEEIVVIGYGRVKKSDLTGAVSSVRGEDLTKVNSTSAADALQGKVAGVQVAASSGEPGSTPTVRIRGVGTFWNPNPIYVVDGVILDDISFLNAADIASMEVLKDASSTAMYGSRGANGVIIITTKSGSTQDKASISFVANYELQTIQKYIDMLNAREFATTLNQILPGSFNNLDLLEDYDWQRMVYRKAAPVQSYQVSANGGNASHNYYASVGYYAQDGIIPGSAYERLSIKVNNNYLLNDHFKIGHNLTVSNFNKDNTPNVVASTLRAWPTDPAYNEDGTFYGNRGNGNPLASIEYTNSTYSGIRAVGNFFGEIYFLENFTFRSSFGMDIQEADGISFTPVYFVTPQQNNDETALSKSHNKNRNWLWENTLNYHVEEGDHILDILGGYTSQSEYFESLSASGKNLLRDEILFLNNDLTDILIGNSGGLKTMVSYLFRANYVLKNKYLFTTTFRADGSSSFSKDNRWGYFPSVALGWRVSEEDFFNSANISSLKVRASAGVVGNDKVNVTSRYTLIQSELGAVFGQDETLYPGSTYGISGNPNIRWEEAFQADLGAEMGIWNNKLFVETDLYYKRTKGILIPLQTPGHLGNGTFASVYYNAADALNAGVELSLTYKDNSGDLFYSFNVNGSTVYNRALALDETTQAEDFLIMGSLGNGQNVKRVTPGEPIGYFYGYNVIGVFQDAEDLASYPHLSLTEVGDFKYEDTDNSGTLTYEDMTYIGSPIPDLVFGLAANFNYKGFSLSMDFQGELGKEIYDGKDAVRAGQYNYQQRVADAWTGPGSTDTEPRISSSTLNYSQSSWFVYDGSYFRMRNIILGYELPKSWVQRFNIAKLTVFLKGTNVFTISKYPGYTPDIGGSLRMNGIDTGVYPVTSVYGAGINMTF